ncbi:ABC transporter ATP-binding protein [Corticibacter populi]|uniref:ABC transporter ATP-binding protein n=1 Tax=Corticibacter populi TaxID=1550736 RepID=A0A3M6QRB3_9BURK|nr:ABC transporter ATP-binding protein [Corticibacter populi]RMX04942.1 ABC transporter ATP-binding protein [Corticibacter populi]RZS33633.1 putative spermidine/putrescine transport system ATP-binding protein [Corticibacter populi]
MTASSVPAATSADVLVSFRGVKKTYDGEHLVVKQLDLDIRKGEFLTLLGPSGSGKTTCLMMLAGFEFPTGGEIRLDGQLLNRVPPHKRNIGMVFQNYALFPHMTVAQNVGYPLQVRGVPAAQRRQQIHEALAMVHMESFAARYPSQLSGGQQQRIALARALVFKPQLVLMDEPLGALDKQLREHMQIELKALHQQLGMTFVYVTHDQNEALTMSDRVAVFEQGVIQQLAPVDQLYEAPDNLFVAGFIGDSNRLSGQLRAGAPDQAGQTALCTLALPDGQAILGQAIGKTAAGQEATASIRPERMRLLDPAEAAPAAGSLLRGRAAGLIYFGDHVRLQCEFAQQPHQCFVKVPLGTPALRHITPGDAVTLAFEPEHLRVYA